MSRMILCSATYYNPVPLLFPRISKGRRPLSNSQETLLLLRLCVDFFLARIQAHRLVQVVSFVIGFAAQSLQVLFGVLALFVVVLSAVSVRP